MFGAIVSGSLVLSIVPGAIFSSAIESGKHLLCLCAQIRSSLAGVPPADVWTFCRNVVQVAIDQKGLAIFVASDSPIALETSVQTGAAPASAAAPAALPAAPSEFHMRVSRGATCAKLVEDFEHLSGIVKDVDGYFGQPVVFRWRGGGLVKAVGFQPTEHSIWQGMSLFESGELSDIVPPEKIVDLAAGSAAKARRGDIDWKDKASVASLFAKAQKGEEFFNKLLDDIEQAAQMYSKEDGKKHPVLFVEVTGWGGDSIAAMAKRSVAPQRMVKGLFYDPREAHRQIMKARRDASVKALYMSGAIKFDGFEPVQLPQEIKTLRESAAKDFAGELSVLSTVDRESQHYLVAPEVASLKFAPDEGVRERIAELKASLPTPPPAKRPRVGAADPSATFPKSATLHELLKSFILLKCEDATISGQDCRILLFERKSDSLTAQYLQNHLPTKRTIPAKSFFTSSKNGRFLDRLRGEHAGVGSDRHIWQFQIAYRPQFSIRRGDRTVGSAASCDPPPFFKA